MTLLAALSLLISAQFSTVSHDIQCRQVEYGNTYVVEYQLDPDETLHEDMVAEYLGLDTALDYSYPMVVGLSGKGCK